MRSQVRTQNAVHSCRQAGAIPALSWRDQSLSWIELLEF